jgi:DNA-binding response OmpR family regulator
MRVLVVEDHANLAGRIAQGLRQAGMAVDTVYDGAATLNAAAQTAYDVIVLDRDLPVVHGDRVCRQVAGRPRAVGLVRDDEQKRARRASVTGLPSPSHVLCARPAN